MVLSGAVVVVVNWQSELVRFLFFKLEVWRILSERAFFILWSERCVGSRQLEVPHPGLSLLAE